MYVWLAFSPCLYPPITPLSSSVIHLSFPVAVRIPSLSTVPLFSFCPFPSQVAGGGEDRDDNWLPPDAEPFVLRGGITAAMQVCVCVWGVGVCVGVGGCGGVWVWVWVLVDVGVGGWMCVYVRKCMRVFACMSLSVCVSVCLCLMCACL